MWEKIAAVTCRDDRACHSLGLRSLLAHLDNKLTKRVCSSTLHKGPPPRKSCGQRAQTLRRGELHHDPGFRPPR